MELRVRARATSRGDVFLYSPTSPVGPPVAKSLQSTKWAAQAYVPASHYAVQCSPECSSLSVVNHHFPITVSGLRRGTGSVLALDPLYPSSPTLQSRPDGLFRFSRMVEYRFRLVPLPTAAHIVPPALLGSPRASPTSQSRLPPLPDAPTPPPPVIEWSNPVALCTASCRFHCFILSCFPPAVPECCCWTTWQCIVEIRCPRCILFGPAQRERCSITWRPGTGHI